MCGRYVSPETAEMERAWHIGRHNWRLKIDRHYNVAPTTQVPILIRAEDGAIELNVARWGLIPSWWKKDSPPSLTFNARSEEAAQKPTWRQSLRTMRCLMPVVGWYEWNEHEKVRSESGRVVNQPYYIHSPHSEVKAFASLWSIWKRPGGEPILSCALLSKEAAPSIADIHHRMPIVLKPEHYDSWLDPTTGADVGNLIADASVDFESYPVSTRVNSARNDGPELLEKLITPRQ
ncbi:MAG TPA: SOS response-associated peptidase [Halioglobus sp.]